MFAVKKSKMGLSCDGGGDGANWQVKLAIQSNTKTFESKAPRVKYQGLVAHAEAEHSSAQMWSDDGPSFETGLKRRWLL